MDKQRVSIINTMPPVRGKLRATSDPDYENRLQAAKNGLLTGVYKSISQAALENDVSDGYTTKCHP